MSPTPERVKDDGPLRAGTGARDAVELSAPGGVSRLRPKNMEDATFETVDLIPPLDGMSKTELASLEASVLPFSIQRFCKRTLDLVGVLVLATVFAPLILAILFVMHRQGGSPIFRHKRVGRNGEVFECLKFRTMVPNAEQVLRELLARNQILREEWDRDHKLKHDPRVTRLGRFLRSTSLDELPQLWNVFRGEMSLVGPRPVTREELLRYGRNMLLYMMVKPGITGLWQVSGRSNTDYRRRVAIDVCYVRNQSVLLDLWILLKTTRVVLGRHGAY